MLISYTFLPSTRLNWLLCNRTHSQTIISWNHHYVQQHVPFSLLPSCLLLHCPQIRLIEGELMQLTKLEIKRRNLDSENLQVGVTPLFLCRPPFNWFLFFLPPVGYHCLFWLFFMSLHHGNNITFQTQRFKKIIWSKAIFKGAVCRSLKVQYVEFCGL